ncbi:agmatine deiminase family protein [Marinobacter salinexigens]|uniref:Agmatine deiminase family protein n=2 Tax=Marinobacter salinexigens TaxID=2919747 RepID=A0A5B0VKK7_9GAMM|nr:agmatine deiminase family protein [Marinobacter salinexigens]KAA1174974.1 agmatine deiminase family protein [Marinobacter salinexigens]
MTSRRVLPAEWAPQSAVMLTWPHPGTDWADILTEVEPVFLEIAKAVLRFEHLVISCEHVARLQELERELTAYTRRHGLPGRVLAVPAPANDTWARDHGPITVLENGEDIILDFRFNAWGNKFPWEKDNALNEHIANAGTFGRSQLQAVDFILEGGSIESDGQGTILTTSECLLAPSRNPSLDRSAIEQLLGEVLGTDRILWLNHGYLAGDDTDSHIDTLARFCAPDHISYVACPDVADEHYSALAAMEEELREFRQPDGSPYRLTALPWPDAIYDEEGERLPATYANFLIIDDAVLLPVYGVPQDGQAVTVLQGIFPDREIIPINCRPLVYQHGSLHCVTMQIPAGVVNP